MTSGPDQHTSDEELLASAARQPDAFGLFYDRYEDAMLAFFYRATGKADVAADLTAEVFARALAGAAGFRPERGSARGWLYGIARHELADLWERRRVEDRARRRLGLPRLALSDEAIERIEQLDNRLSAQDISVLLGELPEDQRAAVNGRVLDEREYADLAIEFACSPSVVRQRVSRGLRQLRTRMEQSR